MNRLIAEVLIIVFALNACSGGEDIIWLPVP